MLLHLKIGGILRKILAFFIILAVSNFFGGNDFTVGRKVIGFIIGFIVGFTIGFIVGFTGTIGFKEAKNEPVTLPFKLTNFKWNNPYSRI